MVFQSIRNYPLLTGAPVWPELDLCACKRLLCSPYPCGDFSPVPHSHPGLVTVIWAPIPPRAEEHSVSQASKKQVSLVSRWSHQSGCLSVPCSDPGTPAAGALGSIHCVEKTGEWQGTLESTWCHGGEPSGLKADGSGRLAFLLHYYFY